MPNEIRNTTIDVDGHAWLIIYAVDMDEAMNAIAHARVSGSVGSMFVENDRLTAEVQRVKQ